MLKKSIHYYSILLLIIIPVLCSCTNPDTEIKVKDGYKSINGTELYYKIMGSGEPIMIVHGGPVLEHGYLFPFLKPLAQDYQLIFFDQRLSGRSSADVDSSEVRLDEFVDDIESLRDSLNLDSIHLMAHSWGGLLAMKYALKYPSNLQSLILLNSMPASSELWQKEEQILAGRSTTEDSLRRHEILKSDQYKNDKPAAIEKLLLLSFRNQFHNPSLADSLDFYIPEDYMKRSRLFRNLMVDIASYDLHSQLSELDIPTLLVYGSDEPATSVSGPKLETTLANSKLSVIPESGHFPFVEQPNQFMREVRDFLTAH
jgi:proline iminopeptidase